MMSSEHGPEPDRELEDLLGHYVDRLNAGEELDRHQILAEQPLRGGEILQELEAFMEAYFSSESMADCQFPLR